MERVPRCQSMRLCAVVSGHAPMRYAARMRMMAGAALVVLLIARVASPCSVVGPLPRPEALVAAASVVALTRATPNASDGTVEFQVIETLKGSIDVPLIRLDGSLTDHDDFNDAEPPYEFVRRDGRRGDCHASTYRAGAVYLLLLKAANEVEAYYRPSNGGALTAYWTPLAPTNEQVHERDDRWVEWVRQRVGAK
jgi:hypothetical protein